MPKSTDDHMISQVSLQGGHAVFLHVPANSQLIGGPEKEKPDKEPDGRQQLRIDQPRSWRHRDNVAVSDGRDRDHTKVHHIGEGHLAIELVLEALPVNPEN